MKRIFLMTLMACFLGLNLWAQPPAPVMEPDDEAEFMNEAAPMALAKLDLTAEQQKTMRTLRTQLRKEMIPLRGSLESKRIDLQEEMAAEKPNLNKINALVDDMTKMRAEMQKKQIAQRLKMREVLTPEQRKMLEAQRGVRPHRMGRGHKGAPDGVPCFAPRGLRPHRGMGSHRGMGI